MKSIVYTAKGVTEIHGVPTPECTDDTLLLKTRYSGLSNGTERNQLLGGNYGGTFPRCPGYQFVGEVVECGKNVAGYEKGDMVFCGDTGSGHCEYVAANKDGLLLKLQDGDDPQSASLWAIATVAYRNAVRLNISPDDNVIVFGGGVIGQVAAQVAGNAGATVRLVAGAPEKLAAAQTAGIIPMNRHDTSYDEYLKEGGPYTVAIETSGADILDMIIGQGWGQGIMAVEGRLALVAGRSRIDYSSNAAQSKALAVYQSGHFRQEHLEAMVADVRGGKIDVSSLVKDVVPIDRAVGTYDTLRDTPEQLFGIVFAW